MVRILTLSFTGLVALIAPANARADNVDFGTNQAGCQAAEQQLHASGNTSADCFQTGPGHYSLTYTERPSYSPGSAYPPAVPAANDYISLAVAPSLADTQAGMGRAPSAAQADQNALAKCAAATSIPCQIIVRAYRGCTALARTPANDIVGAAGADPNAAAAAVLNEAPKAMVIGTWCTERLGN